ncbi:hypothetical protein K3767_07350 [Thermosulfurimonas sp. F29]|nr:hypothetical protein [Thermosulfurimonas sp. F29]
MRDAATGTVSSAGGVDFSVQGDRLDDGTVDKGGTARRAAARTTTSRASKGRAATAGSGRKSPFQARKNRFPSDRFRGGRAEASGRPHAFQGSEGIQAVDAADASEVSGGPGGGACASSRKTGTRNLRVRKVRASLPGRARRENDRGRGLRGFRRVFRDEKMSLPRAGRGLG